MISDDFLRDYQIECRDSILSTLTSKRSCLSVLPTGCGKTVIGLSVAAGTSGGKVLWLAHREELVTQPHAMWRDLYDDYGDVVQQKQTRVGNKFKSRITFASVQTLFREERLRSEFPDPREICLIIIDEGHHFVQANKTYSNIVNYFLEGNPECRVASVTATPDRSDEQALGQSFEAVAFEYQLYGPNGGPSAINDGWLVPIEQETVFIEDLQLDAVGVSCGDFIDSQLEQEMLKEKPLHRVTEATWDISGGKSTIVFTAGVEQAVRTSEIFCRKQSGSSYAIVSRIPDDGKEYPWCVLSSDKDRRRRLFNSFRKGEFPQLVNVGVCVEGFDAPITQYIALGRPTKSRSVVAQQIGRGTRVLPNVIEGKNESGEWWRLGTAEERRAAIEQSDKKNMVAIDFVGNTRHSLVSAIDILGGNMPDEVVKRANENSKEGKSPKNAVDALKQAEEELEEERQKREMARLALDAEKRKLIEAKVAYTRQKVDVFHVLHVHAIREPEWHRNRKPSQRMIDALGHFGVKPEEMSKMSFVTAAATLDRIKQRREQKLCTLKQAKVLAKSGIDPDRISFTHASALIDKLANNKWKPLAPSEVLGIINQK